MLNRSLYLSNAVIGKVPRPEILSSHCDEWPMQMVVFLNVAP
jgi:hypothetical protein